MSANIYYSQIVPRKRVSVSCWAPSSFQKAMNNAFENGNEGITWKLDITSVDILKGMAAISEDGGGNPYQELIDALEKYGDILVEAVQ